MPAKVKDAPCGAVQFNPAGQVAVETVRVGGRAIGAKLKLRTTSPLELPYLSFAVSFHVHGVSGSAPHKVWLVAVPCTGRLIEVMPLPAGGIRLKS